MNGTEETIEDLRWGLTASTVLHVVFFLILFFGLPSFFDPLPPVIHPLVPINIVDIGEITNTRIKEDKAEPQPPAPQPKPAPTPPQPQTPPTPPTPPSPPKPDVPEESLTAPKPQQKPKPPEPPKEEAKPKQQPDQLASVLKNVAKLKPEQQQNDSKTNTDNKEKTTSTSQATSNSPALSDRLTISEEDALRRQISQCWNMPVGAREAQNLIVEVLIDVNPDRTVQRAQVVDQLRMASDPFFRSAAEAALRALRNPKCNPLALNPDKYEQWKTIRFNFDPRDMI
jgi:outer membrane biosynthesis protein TonB